METTRTPNKAKKSFTTLIEQEYVLLLIKCILSSFRHMLNRITFLGSLFSKKCEIVAHSSGFRFVFPQNSALGKSHHRQK